MKDGLKVAVFALLCVTLNAGLGGLFNAVGSAVMNSANNPCPLFNETLVPLKTVNVNDTTKPRGDRKLLATYVYSYSYSSSKQKETYYVDTGNGTGYYATSNTPDICGIWPMRLAICGTVGGAVWGAVAAALMIYAYLSCRCDVGVMGDMGIFVLVFSGIATAFFAAPLGVPTIGCDTPHCQRESFETNSVGFLCGPFILGIVAWCTMWCMMF